MYRRKRNIVLVIAIIMLMLTGGASASAAENAAGAGYDQLAAMQYRSVSDVLDESERHIAGYVSTPNQSFVFEDYIVRVEEIATDGHDCYANISIELLRDDAIAMPLSCTDEADLYYIPLSAHATPVYFFDLSIAIHPHCERGNAGVWALSENLRTIEFVAVYHHRGLWDLNEPVPDDVSVSLFIDASYYEGGAFSKADHEMSISCMRSGAFEMYSFEPSGDVVDAANALGLETPAFQVILTPFQLYTPGLEVQLGANGRPVIYPTYAADGTPYAWLLVTENGEMLVDGRTYDQLPKDASLRLYRLSGAQELVQAWPVQCVEGRIIVR